MAAVSGLVPALPSLLPPRLARLDGAGSLDDEIVALMIAKRQQCGPAQF
jgi:hypothetical protein